METSPGEEIFDIVDAADQVIGQAPRAEVHARNLRHRALHVLIYNERGEFFLQKRSLTKDRFPGCWDSSCSGHLDSGETYAVAAERELGEELGWHLGASNLPLRPLLKLPATEATGYEFIQVYLLGPTRGPFQLNPEEISEGDFVSPVHIDGYLQKYPQFLAGAFCFLWTNHRAELIQESQGLIPLPSVPTTARATGSPKNWLFGLGAFGVFLAKSGVGKFLLLFAKFGKPIISLLFMLFIYIELYGWKFAVSVVLFLFLMTVGRALAGAWCGLETGLPLFIPFFGTISGRAALVEDVQTEAILASGGPLLSSLGSWVFLILGVSLGQDWMIAGAQVGFIMNLVNLIPVPPLNGGSISGAVSPWFWIIGTVLLGVSIFFIQSLIALVIVAIILFTGISRMLSVLRNRHDPVHQQYYALPLWKRILLAIFYLALVGLLLYGLFLSLSLLHGVIPPAKSSSSGDDEI